METNRDLWTRWGAISSCILAAGSWVLAILTWSWFLTRPSGSFGEMGGVVFIFRIFPLTLCAWFVGGPIALALGGYDLAKSGQGKKSTDEMIALYSEWIKKYPIVSIEDGLAENDWAGFAKQTAAMGDKVQIVGDDVYVTNTKFIARGIREKASNAVLIKLNQIGTVTETVEAIQLCQRAGWRYVISHRSGETEDAFMADFAVAMGGGQIKTGSACRSERIAKYNRLLAIEAELGKRAVFGGKLFVER